MRTLIPKTDRVIHITQSTNNNWMRLILRKVNINLGNDSRYTEEELEILNMVVMALENEHEIMEIG
jgi:cell division protein FtsL